MIKQIWAAAIAIVLLSGCTQPAAPTTGRPTITAAGRTSSAVSSEEHLILVPDKHLQQMVDDFNTSHFTLKAECPETKDNPSMQVFVDAVLGSQVASVLVQSIYEADVPRPVTEPAEDDTRALVVEARDGSRYSRVSLYGYNDDHPFYAGKAMLVLENSTGTTQRYLYDKAVFDGIDAEIERRVRGVSVAFNGNCMLLRSKYDLAKIKKDSGLWTGEFLQFGQGLLWRFTAGDPASATAVVEMLSVSTGKSLYSYTMSEPVRRMEKYSGPEGSDYRLFTHKRIIYKNSTNPAWQKEWVLPDTVTLFTATAQLTGGFDVRFEKLAYAAEDGIRLAAQDGSDDQLILSHSALDAVMAGQQGGSWYLNDPRLMLGGTRLVSTITGTQTGQQRAGFAVSDLETLETTYYTGLNAEDMGAIRYPADRVVSVQEHSRLTLIDTKEKEKGAIPLGGLEGALFFTEDYNEFVVAERPFVPEGQAGVTTLYRATVDNLHDRTDKLLVARGDIFYPLAITQNYLVGYCEDNRGVMLTASVYHSARKTEVDGVPDSAQSSSSEAQSGSAVLEGETSSSFDDDDDDVSSSSSSSRVYEENEFGTLPPDITPEWMKEFLAQNATGKTSSGVETNPYYDLYGENKSMFGQDDYMKSYESLFGSK